MITWIKRRAEVFSAFLRLAVQKGTFEALVDLGRAAREGREAGRVAAEHEAQEVRQLWREVKEVNKLLVLTLGDYFRTYLEAEHEEVMYLLRDAKTKRRLRRVV